MDFGVTSQKQGSNAELRMETGRGSGDLKRQRSGLCEERWRMGRPGGSGEVEFCLKRGGERSSSLWGVDDGQKMLSFSSSEPHCNAGLSNGGSRSIAFGISQDELRSRSGGGYNEGTRGPFRLRGPFTPSQWMELEHQALIYKHIVANVPVPSDLLVPLKRSLYSYGSHASYATNIFGWGPFHLGFSGSNDPEPGRCRRTDGKKWRCSRDAVPDQKYCERHINRGRHRSRKPVEGQNGHAVSGSTTSSKVAPVAPPSSAASVKSSSSPSNSLGAVQHQLNALQSRNTGSNSTTNNNLVSDRTQAFQGLDLIPSTNDPKSKAAPFSIGKQHVPYQESSHSEFGYVSSDSLINPTERIPFEMTRNPPDSFLGFNNKAANNQHPVHHFIDDWPKDQSNRASGSWAEELKPDWTQLSMSIPVAPDFSSSSSSPAPEKSTIPTLSLSHELDPIHMSLGVSHDHGEQIQKQSTWLPISWGNSMGGPLGEVLTSTNAGAGAGESLSSMKAWKSNPQFGSSPTGVLQKSTFVSLSNSSSGSSPPSTGNKKGPESSSLHDDLLGPALISSAAIPSL